MSNAFKRFCWKCKHKTCAKDRQEAFYQLRGMFCWLDSFSGHRNGYFYRNLSRAKDFIGYSIDAVRSTKQVVEYAGNNEEDRGGGR